MSSVHILEAWQVTKALAMVLQIYFLRTQPFSFLCDVASPKYFLHIAWMLKLLLSVSVCREARQARLTFSRSTLSGSRLSSPRWTAWTRSETSATAVGRIRV